MQANAVESSTSSAAAACLVRGSDEEPIGVIGDYLAVGSCRASIPKASRGGLQVLGGERSRPLGVAVGGRYDELLVVQGDIRPEGQVCDHLGDRFAHCCGEAAIKRSRGPTYASASSTLALVKPQIVDLVLWCRYVLSEFQPQLAVGVTLRRWKVSH
jgi:hypothetical protein